MRIIVIGAVARKTEFPTMIDPRKIGQLHLLGGEPMIPAQSILRLQTTACGAPASMAVLGQGALTAIPVASTMAGARSKHLGNCQFQLL